MTAAFRWYLSGVGSWFAGYGMTSILFPWLVAVVLHETPQRIGLAQLALMGPSTALLLVGGAFADRRDCRRLLMRYHALAMVPPAALALLIEGDLATYPVVLVYGLALGTLSAFVMPARDSLLTRMVTGGLPRAIALASASQFVFQLAGIALAGTAGVVGPVPLLVLQSLILGACVVTVWQLRAAPPLAAAQEEGRLAAMREGLRVVVRSRQIFPVTIAIAAVGVFYVGSFVVVMPVMVRDLHGGGAAELAILNFCFWGGTVAATLAQVGRRRVERPGRAVLITLTFGAAILAAMGLPNPFWALVGLVTVWGMGAGVTMTQARTMVQLAAPDIYRARVLAVFQLGLL